MHRELCMRLCRGVYYAQGILHEAEQRGALSTGSEEEAVAFVLSFLAGREEKNEV